MYGIPKQTKESFEKTLDTVIAINPEHISAYGLIIEEGTPFYENRHRLDLPSEDTECDMYGIACSKLRAAGYYHYEISNYAKRGFECKHNLKYWKDEEYIGVGLASHSFYGGRRYANAEALSDYVNGNFTKEDLSGTASSDPFEYAMLRLRLAEGMSLSEYEKKFGKRFASDKAHLLKSFSEHGLHLQLFLSQLHSSSGLQ